jgi:hypothetical protein
LIGGDASDITTGATSTWELLQQSFDSEDVNVTYLGKIPYQEKHIKQAQVCIFLVMQRL